MALQKSVIFKLQDPLFRRIRAHAQSRIHFETIPGRAERTAAYREFVRLEREMIQRYHLKGDSGLRVARAGAIVIDVLLEELCETALRIYRDSVGSPPTPFALVGLGGYGRGEMSPFSDIDILFLTPTRRETPEIHRFLEIVTEETLYPLWDMNLKVGHAVRTIKQAIQEARTEPQSKNALLESRFIMGSEALYRKFDRTYTSEYRRKEPSVYISGQIKAQRERREKYGNTVFMQEPDIKNGVGGLRDYQLILWLARVRYGIEKVEDLVRHRFLSPSQMKSFRGAYDFLLRVRNQLHFSVSRPTDLLNLERQPVIAELLGYREKDLFARVEAFMRDYYRAAQTIRRIGDRLEQQFTRWDLPQRGQRLNFRAVINSHRYTRKQRIDQFIREGEILRCQEENVFEEDPIALLRVFRIAQQFQLQFDFDLEKRIEDAATLVTHRVVHSERAAAVFRSILQTPGSVFPCLLRMHELGILGAYLPEFGRLECLVQHEYYHRYTADIHVLRTIRELDSIFNGGSESLDNYRRTLRENSHPSLLYLILLLHDIGKARGIRGHDKLGAEMAVPMLNRLGIAEEQQQQIIFVIRNHLEMARFWQRFDIDDPQTIQSFADFVEDPERLRFLFVHTYCDARGTSEDLWNGYKESLHWKLFQQTLARLSDSGTVELKLMERKQLLRRKVVELLDPGLVNDEIDAHFNLLPDRYFSYHSEEEIGLHLRMVHELFSRILEAESVGSLIPVIDWKDVPDQGLIAVTVVTWDRAGLFYKLAGAFSMAGFNILSTKAISRDDHIAIDTFHVTDRRSGRKSRADAEKEFQDWVHGALVENRDLLPELEKQAAKGKSSLFQKNGDQLPSAVASSVNVYHELSLRRTIIEIRTEDHVGLLFQITRAISRAGFDIVFARINTDGGIADDTFYIESVNPGESVDNEVLLHLREELASILSESELLSEVK